MKGQIKGQWSSWIKWIVALVILFLLLSSGKLDSLSKFSELKNKPLFVFTCLIVLLCNFLLNFRRWQLIVRDFQVSVSFKEAVSLSWIGQFFSIVLPGSVTGDLVKAVYLSKKEKNKRGNIFFSVVLDRFCGLAALLFLGCVFYFLAFVSGISNPQLDSLGLPISLLSIILFLSILFAKRISRVLPKIDASNKLGQIYSKIRSLVVNFSQESQWTIWRSLLLSVLSMGLNIVFFVLVASMIHGEAAFTNLSITSYVLVMVIGFVSLSIPITPLGLGVGQIVFAQLFTLLGESGDAYGVPIVSFWQLSILALNLFGIIPYLFYKQEGRINFEELTETSSS